MTPRARRGELRGVVQGVGFRPFVARLARRLELGGWVSNHGGAVILEVEGSTEALDQFARALVDEAPAAARIDELVWTPASSSGASDSSGSTGFVIEPSAAVADGGVAISPDLRVCAACLAELADPADRRFGYALNGCSECGPRFCLVTGSPWQRERSTMAGFVPCPACAAEFADPSDRRFHAEAIACPECGPQLWLEDAAGKRLAARTEAITAAAALLGRGGILAMQGIGGFQLLVDARDPAAVLRLREHKHRPAKPLALMVASLADADALVLLDELERTTLASTAGPIVLARRRDGAGIAEPVAHDRPRLGVMLATTPAHAQLLAAFGGPLVATSGNVHGRPIAQTHAQAHAELAAVADAWLVHDRAIARRCDDAVTQVVDGRVRVLRLGRGYAPAGFAMPERFAPLGPMLALGAQFAEAPVLLAGARATAWPHVGDLDDPATRQAMHEAIADLEGMLALRATVVAVDAHPDYASTQWARAQVDRECVPVFHHHAHVAAVLAEHGRSEALGVAWDGAGLGPDRTSWGGEFVFVDPRGARRVASLRAFPLPGADAAARDGLRPLAGMLASAGRPDWNRPVDAELARMIALAQRSSLAPMTSSVGRMFDAVAALTGICRRSRYQAEAALALEHAASPGVAPYPFAVRERVVDWAPMLAAILSGGEPPDLVASRFHATLIAMIVAVVGGWAEAVERARTVVLAGGCFANRLLLTGASAALRERGFEVLAAERLPPGDGGLALGQAWVAGHQLVHSARELR